MDNGSGRNILIIEDESDVEDLLALSLRKAGFITLAVADGASGLQEARDPGWQCARCNRMRLCKGTSLLPWRRGRRHF
jgi:DNA-binding response OmpR family regulator